MSNPAAGQPAGAASDRWGPATRTALRWIPPVVAAAAVAFVGLRSGPTGLAIGVAGGVALLATRAWLATPFAFAVGQVALVAAAGTPDPAVWLAEAALVGVLVVPGSGGHDAGRTAVGVVVATAALGGVAATAQLTWGRPWATALALSATGGLIGYGLHRYEQVQLGVVDRE